MSKFRAFLVSTLLATAVIGGVASTGGATEAKAPISVRGDSSWCC